MADFEVPRPQHAPVRPRRRAATAASEHIIANGERKAALATCKVAELTNWAAISRGLARRLKLQRGLRGQDAIAPQRDAGGLGGQKLSSRARWTAGRGVTGWGDVAGH